MPIVFDPINKLVKITSPTTTVNVLDIYTAAMDWADEIENIVYGPPMMAVGKFGMGAGVFSDSIFILIDGWKIKPWSGNYMLTLAGTLITDDESARTVLPDSGNVEVVFQVCSQGITSGGGGGTAEEVWNLTDGIESNFTPKQVMKMLLAVAVGKTTIEDLGGGHATVRFRDSNDTKNRIVADMQDSERLSVVVAKED